MYHSLPRPVESSLKLSFPRYAFSQGRSDLSFPARSFQNSFPYPTDMQGAGLSQAAVLQILASF